MLKKRVCLFFAFLILVFVSCNPPCKTVVLKGIVTKVSDGDSVDFFNGTDTIKVRLQHIDAPERNQAYSKESWQFLRGLVYKKEVILQASNETDRYKRTIGVLILNDETNVNQLMVEKGLAWHFKRYSTDKTYHQLEKQARDEKVGLWKEDNPVPPWNWR